LIFDTGASIQIPYCPATGCIEITHNYVLIEGGVSTPCGWNIATNTSEGTCNGIIESTNNGSPAGGYANQQQSYGIYCSGANNVEIRDIYLENIYVLSGGDYSNFPSGDPDSTRINNCSGSIHDSKMSQAKNSLTIIMTSGSQSWSAYNNEMFNVGGGPSGPLSGGGTYTFNLYGNYIHDFYLWANSPTCTNHSDGIYLFGQTAGAANLTGSVYNNIFYGNITSGGNCFTSYFYLDNTLVVNNLLVFNNVFGSTDAPGGGSGYINIDLYTGSTTGNYFVNNTFVVPSGTAPAAATFGHGTFTFENNLFDVNATSMVNNATGSPTQDYTVYAANAGCANSSGGSSNCWKYSSTFYTNFSGWKRACSCDSHGTFTTGSAGLNSSYIPQSGSIAIGAGVNLASLSITALNSDPTGNARPAGSTAWTAGAYDFANQASAPSCVTATGKVTMTGTVKIQ
jgi:hypothetical protein